MEIIIKKSVWKDEKDNFHMYVWNCKNSLHKKIYLFSVHKNCYSNK